MNQTDLIFVKFKDRLKNSHFFLFFYPHFFCNSTLKDVKLYFCYFNILLDFFVDFYNLKYPLHWQIHVCVYKLLFHKCQLRAFEWPSLTQVLRLIHFLFHLSASMDARCSCSVGVDHFFEYDQVPLASA